MWDFSFTESDLFLEFIDSPVEFFAGVRLEHLSEFSIAVGPDVLLLLVILDVSDGLFDLIVSRDFVDLVSPLPVFRVTEAGMVGILDAIAFR